MFSEQFKNLNAIWTSSNGQVIEQSFPAENLNGSFENIIISKSGSPVPFNHSKIKYVFIDPKKKELAMVIGLTALGGISGYLGIILGTVSYTHLTLPTKA